MELFYRNATPIYKGRAAQPQATGGFLTGLIGSLFGNHAPSYKTVDGRGVNAQPSASWWPGLSSTPSYKTVPTVPSNGPAMPAQEVAAGCDAPLVDIGEGAAEQTCVCAPEDATQIVILE